MVKGSHNPYRPSYRGATQGEYSALYSRLEKNFKPGEMTRDALIEWLGNSTLADAFAVVGDLDSQISNALTIEELRDLKSEVRALVVHKSELLDRIAEREEELELLEEEIKVARAISSVEEFAESKDIVLDETTKGGIYSGWGRSRKSAFVIFKNGKIFTWMYLEDEDE